MKLSKLFVLGALGLVSLGANAADLIERTAPIPDAVQETPVAFEIGKTYILYNVGTEMYFAQGSTWSTRGCIVPTKASAVKIRVAKYTIDNVWDGKTYEVQTYVTNRSSYGWYKMTMNAKSEQGNDQLWLDQTGGNYETLYEIVGAEKEINADVNVDGSVDVADISAIISDMAGTESYPGADVNGDGTVDVADISAVISYMADHSRQLKMFGFIKAPSADGPTYRFMPSQLNKTEQSDGTQFVGYAGLEYDSSNDSYDFSQDNGGIDDKTERLPLSALTTENVDWMFYAFPAFDAYEKSKDLKALILKAEAVGADVTAAVEVYNNEDATVEQMEAAMKALNEALSGGISGSADAPGDATSLITNPDFDSDNDSNGDSDGWSGTTPNMVGSGAHGPACVAEQYDKTFDTYQDIIGMPAGVYGLSASTTFRGSWADFEGGLEAAAKLYATVDNTTYEHAFDNMWSALNTVSMAGATEFGTNAAERSEMHNGATYYTPNDPSAARLYFEKGYYQNAIVFESANGGARIGVKNPAKNGTGDNWSIFDTFRLTYYGNEGAKSYKAWLNDNAMVLYAAEAKVTNSYVEAFKAFVKGQAVEDAASANAAYADAKNSSELADLKKNIALWGQFSAKVEEALALGQDPDFSQYAGDLVDYCEMDALSYIEQATMTNEEIEAEIAKIEQMMEEVKEAAKNALKPGDDVTRFLTNPAFDSNTFEGWTVENTGTSVGNTRVDVKCAEAWHNNGFDIYQEIKDVPVGIYEISVQGYVRYHDGTQSVSDWEGGNVPSNIPVYVYLNNNTTQFANVYENPMESGFFANYSGATYLTDGNSFEYPDNMTAAAAVFGLEDDTKNYTKKAYGLIANAGDVLRIGVKGTPTDCWVIFDNFKLTYCGFDDANMIKPILEEAINSIDLSKPMGKSVYAKAADALSKANDALTSGNGTTMFEAANDIFALNAEINASVALFAELQDALQGLLSFAGENDGLAAAGEALEFYETTLGNISQVPTAYEDSDVPDLMDKIQEYYSLIRAEAAGIDFTNTPADCTALIATPSFENEVGENSVDGWNATGYNFGNDDTQKSALALEFYNKAFDLNQTLYGLPNGKYRVEVNAFARLNEAKTNPVYLYANNAQVEVIDLDQESGIGDMVSAAAAFSAGQYLNTLEVTVTDKTLRIGIKKETNNDSTTDWVIMDNWKLWYLGE